jgi:hypothetical protein
MKAPSLPSVCFFVIATLEHLRRAPGWNAYP